MANPRGKTRKADVLEETPESDVATTKVKAKAKNKLTRKQQIEQLAVAVEDVETDQEADEVDGDKENSEASG